MFCSGFLCRGRSRISGKRGSSLQRGVHFFSFHLIFLNISHENITIWSQTVGFEQTPLFKQTPEPTLDPTLLKVSSVRPDKMLKCKDFVFLTL